MVLEGSVGIASRLVGRCWYLFVEFLGAPRECRPWRAASWRGSSPCPWRTCRGLACETGRRGRPLARTLWWPTPTTAPPQIPPTAADLQQQQQQHHHHHLISHHISIKMTPKWHSVPLKSTVLTLYWHQNDTKMTPKWHQTDTQFPKYRQFGHNWH